ncbi:MAG: VWA domain-containing protein [Acidobacteria bacterium]|nr:VWA domain-containing protein [Acidobacteriota bacterium]
MVSLDVTVTDRKGRPVADLRKEDFLVYEDGKQQKVAFFSREQRPASWGLVLDRSGSMADMIEDVYQAALHSIESGTPEDEIFAMTFNDSLELVQPFTSDRLAVLTSIRDLTARGQTALYDAGALALDYMKGARHKKRVLVIVTDGEDNASSISFNKFLNIAQKSETIIYTVGFFGSMDNGFFGFGFSNSRKQLERLAEQTGGMAYFPKNMEECISAHRDIALQVSRQYNLGYYPSNTDWDEGWREIRVEVLRSGNLVVRSPKSYFAPKTER